MLFFYFVASLPRGEVNVKNVYNVEVLVVVSVKKEKNS